MKHIKLIVSLLSFSLFSQLLFYGFNIITGRQYGGASVDSSFISFMMIVDVIPLLFFIYYMLSPSSKRSVIPCLFLLFFTLFILLLEGDIRYTVVKSFIAFSIPSALIGILIAKFDAEKYFVKWLEPLMLFLTLVGISSMSVIMSVSIMEAGREGIGIQSLSYYSAFAFAINLFFLLFGDGLDYRFFFSRSLIYKVLSIALLVVQVVVTLSSGGRGGFVLLAVSSFALVLLRLFYRGNSLNNKRFPYALFTCIFIVVALAAAFKFMPVNISDTISMGTKRTFSYLTKDGINMSETSNRDLVYAAAIKAIRERPLFGYGLLMKGTYFEDSWPHNILLEILLQGGFFLLLIFIVFLFFVLRKLRIMIKAKRSLFIIPIILYPLVMLCFSGSYMSTGLFWFSLTYIICCEIPVEKPVRIGN